MPMAEQQDICTRIRAAMHPTVMNGNPDALLGEAAEYIAVIDSGVERAMEVAEKASAVVQLQGKEIERLRREVERVILETSDDTARADLQAVLDHK